jgi:hypothetical protein
MRIRMICEAVEHSDYGYWVTPTGQALVVPDSAHYKILSLNYQGDAAIGQDRYGNVIAEGWCWVNISGQFLCFLDPGAVTRAAVATLLRIIAQYEDDFSSYRIVFTRERENVGREKHDFADAMTTKAFLRGLLSA